MRRKVICIQPLHAEGMKILHARDDLEIIVPETPDPATWANFLPGAEAICVRLSQIPRTLIEAAPNLKIISRHGVGCDNIDVKAATDNGDRGHRRAGQRTVRGRAHARHDAGAGQAADRIRPRRAHW